MPPHPLTNFEIQKYYKNEKDGAYVINLDEHSNIGTHWVGLYVQNNNNNNNNIIIIISILLV